MYLKHVLKIHKAIEMTTLLNNLLWKENNVYVSDTKYLLPQKAIKDAKKGYI